MSAVVGMGWSERTSYVSTGMPRRAARRPRISRLPRSPYVDSRSGKIQTIRRVLSVDTVQLRSDVLERRVVRDHFEAAGRTGPDRLVKRLNVPEGHIVHFQPYCQVVGAVAGDQHLAPAQRGEVDVVEPRRVEAVGVAGVDGEQGGRDLGHVERLQPARRSL